MSIYHNRPTVVEMRAMKARRQKISMLPVTNFEEAAAAAAIHTDLRDSVNDTTI